MMKHPVFITGAASGIGRQCALTLAKHYDLVLLDRQESALKALEKELHSSHQNTYVVVDLNDEGALNKALQNLSIEGLEALINVASLSPENKPFTDVTSDLMLAMFEVNTLAPMRLFQWAYPYLLKGKTKAMINVSSVHTKTGLPKGGVFRASKRALETWSEQIALDYAKEGLRVNTICPGGIQSKMLKATDSTFGYSIETYRHEAPLKQEVSAQDVADLVMYLLSDSARSITAQTFVIDAGYSKR